MAAKEVDTDDCINFLDLNDDCLVQIFEYLSVDETLSLLGCICPRIDEIVYERLALVKHLSINLRDPPLFTPQQLEIIGRSLRSLYISAGYSLAPTLTLKYLKPICCQHNLRFLALHYVQFDGNYQECLLNVAPQLQFLDLSYCQLTDDLLEPILGKCDKLKSLTIFGNYNLRCYSLRALSSKNLGELKVEQNSSNREEIKKFSERNPQATVTVFAIGYLGHMNSRVYLE